MATNSSDAISSDDIKQVFKASGSTEPKAVLIQVIVMSALSTLMIIAFNLLRPTNKTVYEPKTTYHAQDQQPPRISSSFFGWIPPLMYNHERHLFPTLGLDAIAFLRFLHLMRWLFTATAIVSCALLIPLDIGYTITNNPPQHDILSGLTIRDVQGSKLYAHVGCLYFITLLLMALVYHHWRAMYRLRHQWLHSPEYQHAFYARTLLVTNIPEKYRSEDGLWRIFDGMNLPYQVTSVHIGKEVGNLPQLVEEHNKNVQELEEVLVRHGKNDPYFQERPTVKVGGILGFGGTHEDAVKLLSHKLKQSAAAAEQYRLEMLRHEPDSYGFVSMASIPAAHGAAFDLRNEHPKGLLFELAPNPKDIFWENISLSKGERRFRTITGFIFMILFCTSSLIPIFPIASIANLDALAKSNAIPFLHSWVQSSPSSYALASGVIPPTIAALFNMLIPRLMRWLSKYMGANTHTTLDRVVIARYFTFMIVSQLILFTIFGVALNSVLEIIDAAKLRKPTLDSVLNNLNKLPARFTHTYVDQSSFWLKWFALSGFIIVFDLAQIANLVYVSLKSRFIGRTPREVREWTKPPIFDYAINYSNLLFMGAVGLVFAPLAPLIPLAAAIVFWTSSWVFKYQLMYVFVTRVEGGGRSWNMIINRVLFSAGFMQVIAILTIGLQHQFQSLQFLASIPPLIMTILFKHYLNKRFADDFQYFLPHFEELARAIVHSEESDVVGRKLEVRYCHPALQLQTQLQMPLVYPESLPLLRRSSRSSKYRHRDRSRGVDVEKARSNLPGSPTGPEELVEGVTVTPVNEDQVACDPAQYSRDREAECDRDSLHSVVSSEDSAPWRRSLRLAESTYPFHPGYESPSQHSSYSYTQPVAQHDPYTHVPGKSGGLQSSRRTGDERQQHRSGQNPLLPFRTGKSLPITPTEAPPRKGPSNRRQKREQREQEKEPSSTLSSSTSPSYRTARDDFDQVTPPLPTLQTGDTVSPLNDSRRNSESYRFYVRPPSEDTNPPSNIRQTERSTARRHSSPRVYHDAGPSSSQSHSLSHQGEGIHRYTHTQSQIATPSSQTPSESQSRQSRSGQSQQSAHHPARRSSARASRQISGQPFGHFAFHPDSI